MRRVVKDQQFDFIKDVINKALFVSWWEWCWLVSIQTKAADFIKGMAKPSDWVLAVAKFDSHAIKPGQVGLFIRCRHSQSCVFLCLCTSRLDVNQKAAALIVNLKVGFCNQFAKVPIWEEVGQTSKWLNEKSAKLVADCTPRLLALQSEAVSGKSGRSARMEERSREKVSGEPALWSRRVTSKGQRRLHSCQSSHWQQSSNQLVRQKFWHVVLKIPNWVSCLQSLSFGRHFLCAILLARISHSHTMSVQCSCHSNMIHFSMQHNVTFFIC